MEEYTICSRCIMDTSDPWISFDEKGVCSHCRGYDLLCKNMPHGQERENKLESILSKIKKEGQGKDFDCVLGISGGVDSAYVAYLAKKMGLRVLAVHVDAGWNSDTAVSNIQKMCSKLGYELHTIVIDWETIKELQRAYMFSGLPNLDIPQDHVFIAAVYQYARKYKVRYILSGGNFATEGILPQAWGYTNTDYTCIKDVYRKHGRGRIGLSKYPHIGFLRYSFYNYAGLIRSVRLLDYVDYSKKEAMETLEREFDWVYYGGKHYESRFTKFFQGYYLPRKFGYDKKRAHLSSLIVNGEMTREEALREMDDHSDYTKSEMEEDLEYILKKLDISPGEWDEIMAAPAKTEDDYRNDKKITAAFRRIKQAIK